MKIILVDVDSKMPNLALMKLSAWHKAQGDQVKFWRFSDAPEIPENGYDKIYVSCIFTENAPIANELVEKFPNVEIGGYGVNGTKLPNDIEHIRPDYSLYGCDFSMGFTSRGCIRSCPFCIVPEKEGPIRDHAPISEFLHPNHNKLILLDNNFLASPRWRENLRFVASNGLKVNFNQGLDIRLVNKESAGMLADCRYYSWTFKTRQLHFAFDSPEIEDDVRRGVQLLRDAGIPPRSLMFYMLVGFDTTFEQDYHRYQILWEELGVYPFVMVYNNRRDIPILRHFARWVNKRIHKVDSWENYDPNRSFNKMVEKQKLCGPEDCIVGRCLR